MCGDGAVGDYEEDGERGLDGGYEGGEEAGGHCVWRELGCVFDLWICVWIVV